MVGYCYHSRESSVAWVFRSPIIYNHKKNDFFGKAQLHLMSRSSCPISITCFLHLPNLMHNLIIIIDLESKFNGLINFG